MNYNKGDYVIYNGLEICIVGDTVRRSFDGENEREYVMIYPAEAHTTVYIPAEKSGEMLRPVLSKEKLLNLIDMMSFADDKADINKYSNADFSDAVKSGDHEAIISVMSTIYNKGAERAKSGKQLLKADRRNFEAAKKLIDSEIALAFGIKASEAEGFILNAIANHPMSDG